MKNNLKIMVYWFDEGPRCSMFIDLGGALNFANEKRNDFKFVSLVTENLDRVGLDGVQEVKNNTLPNGEQYHWKKRRI